MRLRSWTILAATLALDLLGPVESSAQVASTRGSRQQIDALHAAGDAAPVRVLDPSFQPRRRKKEHVGRLRRDDPGAIGVAHGDREDPAPRGRRR